MGCFLNSAMVFGFLLLIINKTYNYLRSQKIQMKLCLPKMLIIIPVAIVCIYLSPYLIFWNQTVALPEPIVLSRKEYSNYVEPVKWYGIYEAFGCGSESRFNQNMAYDVDWCVMDLEHHTYIVSFGQEITTLKYNVWKSERAAIFDFGTSFKSGIVEFGEKVDLSKVYVYEINKIRIDHDFDINT